MSDLAEDFRDTGFAVSKGGLNSNDSPGAVVYQPSEELLASAYVLIIRK